ncbi:MAG: hypothetical protein AABN33_22195 [Acidobacteriota bacterium]
MPFTVFSPVSLLSGDVKISREAHVEQIAARISPGEGLQSPIKPAADDAGA